MNKLFAIAISLGSMFVSSIAVADDDDVVRARASVEDHVDAPSNALELAVGGGYTQGVGPMGGGLQHVEDLTSAGGAVELDAMYRIDPTFAVGVFGTFSSYSDGENLSGNHDIFGATAGIQGAAHLRPSHTIDPWISVGTGWRGLWLSPQGGKNTSLQGLELARLQIGVDYRLGKDIAISPVIGGALDMYVSEDGPMTNGYDELSNKKVNFMGFAGLAGRFDYR